MTAQEIYEKGKFIETVSAMNISLDYVEYNGLIYIIEDNNIIETYEPA